MTTARDVAIMSRELIKHEKIFDYSQTWIDYLRDGQTQLLVNTNKLLKTYNGITGLKTGTTGKAGSCISAHGGTGRRFPDSGCIGLRQYKGSFFPRRLLFWIRALPTGR